MTEWLMHRDDAAEDGDRGDNDDSLLDAPSN